MRVERGLTQGKLAAAIGVSLETYRRLERGRIENPPLRYLGNAALVLGVELEALVEDEWRTWAVLSPDAPGPPA